MQGATESLIETYLFPTNILDRRRRSLKSIDPTGAVVNLNTRKRVHELTTPAELSQPEKSAGKRSAGGAESSDAARLRAGATKDEIALTRTKQSDAAMGNQHACGKRMRGAGSDRVCGRPFLCAVLCCAVLCCAVLCCAVLCCAVRVAP
jgi:hypothetical protein